MRNDAISEHAQLAKKLASWFSLSLVHRPAARLFVCTQGDERQEQTCAYLVRQSVVQCSPNIG
jgi:hypothetical protein